MNLYAANFDTNFRVFFGPLRKNARKFLVKVTGTFLIKIWMLDDIEQKEIIKMFYCNCNKYYHFNNIYYI